MTTAQQAIRWIAGHIGDPGDNGGHTMWELAGAPGLAGSAWCGCTLYADAKALDLDLGPFTFSEVIFVPGAVNVAKANGLWGISKNSHPGDWVAFEWGAGSLPGADHFGMIVANDPAKSYVTTIEGNAGAKGNGQRGVAYHTRSRSLIAGTIDRQAAYSKAPAPKPHPVTPTVVTSEYFAGPKVGKAMQDHFKSAGTHDGYFDSQDAANKKFFPNFTCIRWTSTRADIKPSPGVQAIQRGVGVKADGYLGKATASALQRWAGLKGKDVDSYLGSKSVEAICTKLGVK